jgi:hypothetical protein
MSSTDVLDVIKASIKVNLTYVDKVVIVCSGRIERAHSDSIKQFMKWLSFTEYMDKFVFVYNKADTQSLETRVSNLAAMCDILKADTHQTNVWQDLPEDGGGRLAIKMNLTTGFPPSANYDQVKEDHKAFTRACLCVGPLGPNAGKRVPVDKSSCTLL